MQREQYGKARIVVVTIIDEELDAVLGLGQFKERCPGTQYYAKAANSSKEYDVVVCRADGWGNIASGDIVTEAIEDFRPSYILLVGIAGGIVRDGESDPIRTGDVLIADYLHYSELKKLVEKGMVHRYKAHDHPSLHLRLSFAEPLRRETKKWIGRIKAQPPVKTTPVARIGNLVTGETLLGNPRDAYQQNILSNYYSAAAVDMESMGVGREICRQRRDPYYNPQFLVIRGISDLVKTTSAETDATLPAGTAVDRAKPSREAKSSADNQGARNACRAIIRKISSLVKTTAAGTDATLPAPTARDAAKPSTEAQSAAENQKMRDAWRAYAAEAAASFALALIDDILESIGSYDAKAAQKPA